MIIIIILYMFTSCLTTCVLFHQSPALIIVRYACSLLDITILLPALICMCSRHNFQCMFINRIYRYTCAYPCRHLTFTTPLVGEFLTPLDSHVQIPELGACGFSRLLIRDAQRKRGSSTDRLRPYPFRLPARLSSFYFVTRERLLYNSLLYLFVIAHLHLSVM